MDLDHILFIPDGNRRWAKKRNENPWEGHRVMMETFEVLMDYITKNNIVKNISFFAMSRDNFTRRSKEEVKFFIKIINEAFEKFSKNKMIQERGVNIKFYGTWEKILGNKIVSNLKQIENDTKNNKNFFLSILFAYDGKDELIEAINSFRSNKKINENDIRNNLWTKSIPEVDLIIRTGVDKDPHLSGNVLMWQTSYSQLYFSEKLWPDFNVLEFKKAINDYAKRERRKGK